MNTTTAPEATDTVEPVKVLQILKFLLTGRDYKFIGEVVGLGRVSVEEIAVANGWPDRDKTQWAIDLLTEKTGGRSTIPTGSIVKGPVVKGPIANRPAPAPAAAAPADPALAVLVRLEKHPSKKFRVQGQRIRARLIGLGEELDAADAAAAARAAETEERRRAREKVARLERELAAAKAALRKQPASRSEGQAPTAPVTTKEDRDRIRAWAAENGRPAPAHGRIPAATVTAYYEALPESASTTPGGN